MHININEGFIFYEKNLPHHKGQFHWSEMLFCSTGPCYLPLGISKPCKHSKQIYPWGCTYMEFWPLLIFVYPLPLLCFVFKTSLFKKVFFIPLSSSLSSVSNTVYISDDHCSIFPSAEWKTEILTFHTPLFSVSITVINRISNLIIVLSCISDWHVFVSPYSSIDGACLCVCPLFS